MPRARSSGSRSVSFPVSARTSVVLPWSTCPAVPTVSAIVRRGWSAAPRPEDGAGDLVDLVRRQRARVQQQAAVAHDPDDRRVAQPELGARLLLDRARGARELGQRERAAADPRDGLLDLPADEPREPLGALADGVDGLVEHPEHRDLPPRELGVGEERERPLERRERQLVGAQRALQRMPPQPLDEVGAPDDDARLGAAEKLVAREADEVGAGGDARRGGGLVADVEERARAEVVDERERGSLRDPRQRPATDGCSANPTIRKFDWWTRRSAAVSGPIARS